jgi:iron(III)-enterobactin esterase
MRKVVTLLSVCSISVAMAQTPPAPQAQQPRPEPPRRAIDGPGAPLFTKIPTGNALSNQEGEFVIGPDYAAPPELTVVDDVPVGKVTQFTLESKDSRFYPGIARDVFGTPDPRNPKALIVETHPKDYQRTITVYVPAQYTPGSRAPLIVTHDGPALGAPDAILPRILDNLIAQKRVPVMIAVMIQNGGGDAQGSERGLEYDTMSGKFAEFIEAEVLPAVEQKVAVKISRRGADRAVMGCSSGAAAAFTMAWNHPEWYQRVISYSGTYVNQQWPYNPATPGGAWEYHSGIIANSPVKPIRVWMHVGDRDLYNPNVMRDDMHDWVTANHPRFAAALKSRGYHYQYVFALDSTHCDRRVREQTLPEALEFVWR